MPIAATEPSTGTNRAAETSFGERLAAPASPLVRREPVSHWDLSRPGIPLTGWFDRFFNWSGGSPAAFNPRLAREGLFGSAGVPGWGCASAGALLPAGARVSACGFVPAGVSAPLDAGVSAGARLVAGVSAPEPVDAGASAGPPPPDWVCGASAAGPCPAGASVVPPVEELPGDGASGPVGVVGGVSAAAVAGFGGECQGASGGEVHRGASPPAAALCSGAGMGSVGEGLVMRVLRSE